MRVTTKGQVTIPKDIRDELGIVPGSEVEFVRTGDGVIRLVAVDGELSSEERKKPFPGSAGQDGRHYRPRWNVHPRPA
jgi:AbrB family looped-hinge helix DNA binding protein